eukprot:171016-Amphidinium_carterae.1
MHVSPQQHFRSTFRKAIRNARGNVVGPKVLRTGGLKAGTSSGAITSSFPSAFQTLRDHPL